MALSVSLSVGSKTPSHSIEGQVGEVDSLAPFQGANAIPCPLGMDIEFLEPHIRARYQEKLSLLGEAEA